MSVWFYVLNIYHLHITPYSQHFSGFCYLASYIFFFPLRMNMWNEKVRLKVVESSVPFTHPHVLSLFLSLSPFLFPPSLSLPPSLSPLVICLSRSSLKKILKEIWIFWFSLYWNTAAQRRWTHGSVLHPSSLSSLSLSHVLFYVFHFHILLWFPALFYSSLFFLPIS